MDFQKIILVGTIISKPEIQKTEEGVLDVVRFNISVNHFTEKEVTFPVVSIRLLDDDDKNEIIKGITVIVEGIIDIDESGKFIVRADYYHVGKSERIDNKESQLLF